MNILKLLIYYFGIQLVLSTLLYFYYLMYWTSQCKKGEDVETPSSDHNKVMIKKIMKIFMYCAFIALLYHSYLNVKYRH